MAELRDLKASCHPVVKRLSNGLCSSEDNQSGRNSDATAQAAKPERTILVCGVPDGLLNDDLMADILMIHFQKAKNKGGDVEDVAYPTATKGVAYVTFEDKRVAENVLKGEHSLEDKRLPEGYPLKVSPYGQSAFICITCNLNLSVLGGKCNLEDLVQELQKKFSNLSFGPLSPDGHICVQGPFSAVSSLQNELISIARHSVSERNGREKEKGLSYKPDMKPGRSGVSLEPRDRSISNKSKETLNIVLDTDIYRYMKTFKNNIYQKTLEKYGVRCDGSEDGEVTVLYLTDNSLKPGPSKLEDAKNTIESLVAKLTSSLRKDSLSWDGSNSTEKRRHKEAWEAIAFLFPNVLIIPYSNHIDIIGSSSDVYEFACEFSRQVDKMAGNVPKTPWR